MTSPTIARPMSVAPRKKTPERESLSHGGYVTCMDGLDQGLAGIYSYGINGFDGWGMEMASRYKLPLNEYDCTNFNAPAACSGCDVHFHGECILENNGYPLNHGSLFVSRIGVPAPYYCLPIKVICQLLAIYQAIDVTSITMKDRSEMAWFRDSRCCGSRATDALVLRRDFLWF